MRQEMDTLVQIHKTIFPNISDRDINAFIYSKPVKEPYQLGTDSERKGSVPEGTVTKYHWINRKFYSGTARDYWIYVPKQYNASKPACLMVFQDGGLHLVDMMEANIVLDNLIHKQVIPVIIGLFINPGDKGPGMPIYGGAGNRSVEYDTVSDLYSKFLMGEILPELKKQYHITDDPKGKAIAGISSGGICAFNVAWQRPDAFGKVISHCGSYTSIRGGDQFPEMIRKTPAKPIKVFLQSGSKDLNVVFGSWALKDKEMAAALEYSGYDYKFVFGKGGHSLKHGASIFPETLKWLWSDYPKI